VWNMKRMRRSIARRRLCNEYNGSKIPLMFQRDKYLGFPQEDAIHSADAAAKKC